MINQTTNLFSQLANQYLKGEIEQDVITDPEIQKVVHGLQKKSETTKIKTLSELKTLLPNKSQEFFEQFTPTFVNIYRRYVDNEYERRVLELSNQVLSLICEYGKKSLSKKFKQLFPQWFIMMNDYNSEISTAALNAFQIAFPTKERQTQAIKMCSDQYIIDLKLYMSLSIATIKQESNLEDEKVDHIYERLKVSAINSIKTAIEWNPDNDFIEQIMKLLDFTNKTTIIVELLNTQKTRIVATIIETLHFLLSNDISAPFVLHKSDQLLKKTVQLFEQKDRLIVSALWKGFITKLFQRVQQDQILKLQGLENKSLELISKAGFGVGKLLYDQLVIFVSLNPIYSIVDIKKEEVFRQKLASMTKLLNAILSGITHEESRFFSENLINSYFEILYFLVCKRMIPCLVQYNQCLGQVKNIIVQSIKSVLQNTLSQQGVQAYNHNPYKQVPFSLLQFFNILKVKEEQQEFLNEIIKSIMSEFKTLQLDDYQVFVNIISQLFKVKEQSPAYQTVQQYLIHVFDEIYNNNDFERGSLLFEIIPNSKNFKKDNFGQKIQEIINNLFNSIELVSSEELLKKCSQVKIYIYNLQRINEQLIIETILQKIITQEYKQVIPKEEQQIFKLKWICLHNLVDISLDPQFYLKYLTMKDSQQEYNLIEKYVKYQQLQQNETFITKFLSQSLSITNLSQKIFIPCIIQNANQQILNILISKYQQIGQQVIKTMDKNYLQIFEELSYIMNKIQPQQLLFDVLLQLYLKNQSQKGNFLYKLINKKYQDLFVQFFQTTLPLIKTETLQQHLHFFQDLFTQLNSQDLLQFLNFNFQSSISWKILSLIEIPQDYFKKMYQNNQLELLALFLASNYSSIMLYDHKLKRFIQNILGNQIIPIFLDSYEQQEPKSLDLIKILFNNTDIVYGVALKNLIKQITIEERENNYRSKQTDLLAQLIVEQLKIALNDNNVNKLITIRQIINVVDLKQQFQNVLQTYHQNKQISYLDLYTLMLRQQSNLLELEDETELDQTIKLLFEMNLESNYDKMVVFDFINLICERKTITPFAAYIKQINNLFRQLFQQNVQLKRFYSFSIVSALQFVRKILNFIEAFPIEFIDYLNFELTDSLLQIIQFCENPNPEFMDEQNDTLFIEYAETLLRCIQMEQWQKIDDSIYYQLLQCPFISIQKAAFIALKNIQDHSGLSPVLDGFDMKKEEMRRLRQEDEEDVEDIITFPLDGKILTNLLAWLVVLQNKNCVQFKDKYPTYLSNLLYILQFLNDNGVMAKFNYKEIYQQDLNLMVIQDDQSELLKMIVISFYQFIVAQQSYFKQWYNQECNTTQKKQLEDLLQIISKAIYTREIELIELNQEEWRSEGFDIYISKNQQEITATYQKEEQKIEILIQVPVGFPLKPLKVETKKGVKISEDKLKKWSLMIRMILQNENDTILTALKLWKKNIDQQFQDLEECAICYYIIHQNGELPKMACRTCKHKFHSTCIQKWFHSSNKSDCPLCKSQFL
ncbi:unnamed protein product [Paramecium pentaurelia]|uniref:E3 ubiquitin-protein ligase listerin n=1 Tax=Paramecium pentaurelia TaxID=43138 RepID=A0A8S1WI45_9CILI|nr:unnamed protein product [Paramecium pentaurelia]